MATESQDEILNAAVAAIAEKGIEGLRTRDVAGRAGINISTLHYHFGTKERLLLAVLDHVVGILAASLQREHAIRKTAREELRAHLNAAFRTFRGNPEFAAVLQELRIRAGRDRSAREAFRAVQRRWNATVEQILTRAAENGEMRRAIHPRAGAVIVTSFIMGITLQLWMDSKSYNAADAANTLESALFE
jgi:AcrR family transcriptional regulator